jgi:ABC-type multidrug transport system fused ATPase/permease subunit
MKKRIRESIPQPVLDAYYLIPKSRRARLILVVVVQASLAILDLIGIALVGVIGALSVSGVKSASPSLGVGRILELLGLEGLVFQSQIAILGVSAASFLILKTLLSSYLTRRILKFLSINSALISAKLYERLIDRPRVMLDGSSSQKTLYAVTQGVQSINVGAIGSIINLVAEATLLIVLVVGLLFFDPLLAVVTAVLFGVSSLMMYLRLHRRAQRLGLLYSELTIKTNELFVESKDSYRELFVRNRLPLVAKEFRDLKEDLGNVVAETAFMPLLTKYAIEVVLILGSVLLAAIQFSRGNAEEAAASLGVFFATSSRLAPSILRMQQSLIALKISLSESSVTSEFIASLDSAASTGISRSLGDIEDPSAGATMYPLFTGEVRVNSISVKYASKSEFALKEVSLFLPAGSFTAVVGPSGAGKSTLADCILGIVQPSSGSVSISGMNPVDAVRAWPGKIGYVPQESHLSPKTISENITFGERCDDTSQARVMKALAASGLESFVKSLPGGLDSVVGERGAQLSGGQRQRIGIARALFTDPRLLILDEATSALDSVNEGIVAATLSSLKGVCTLVVIAHRLSTIRHADQVIFLNKGRVEELGSFDEVYSNSKIFAEQVDAMRID